MVTALRFPKNPILAPNPGQSWESEAAFNGCPVIGDDGCHLLYRAQSGMQTVLGHSYEVSSIGHAVSFDRVTFLNRRQFIAPTESWEKYGCEDPRVTWYNGVYYIFYTAISTWPPSPPGISVAMAETRDFISVGHKYHITPFNAKAMTLFPSPVNGKMAVLLTANCDIPPSTIGVASVDSPEQLTDPAFWHDWYKNLSAHAVPLLRSDHDHVEIGAPPMAVSGGWLLIYSYIKSYRTSHKFFGIEAVLLDRDDPRKIISRTAAPILYPEYDYELSGKIQNVIFPSGALIHNNTVGIYYGAADTSTCLATVPLSDLMESMR